MSQPTIQDLSAELSCILDVVNEIKSLASTLPKDPEGVFTNVEIKEKIDSVQGRIQMNLDSIPSAS